ncbi:cytidine deaminase [Chelatococcus reniformis]|uniref:Cytidine deaminase n=1 Tax=Chelatococcus reniformis TaxID=1494448 RepID=A0A916U3T4_9HYPH|nr:cytidine deaminase [Chelatococcus reniformis]GGC59581.1 cytidine deaminase [Chelatococcus reniformis]
MASVTAPDPASRASGLTAAAQAAALNAHAPYSRFRVGAAVRAGGQVYTGCNVENASYGLAICAERVAIFKAVAAGARRLEAVAVACIDASPGGPASTLMPCGACRQVMAEFADSSLPVEVVGVGTFTLADLLPQPFTLGDTGRS